MATPAVDTMDKDQAKATLSLALDKIEAAGWLLDQIKVGELSGMESDEKVSTWLSTVGQTPENFVASLEHWAIETIGEKVQEIRRCLEVVTPEPKRDE